jgi:hypothetical protein
MAPAKRTNAVVAQPVQQIQVVRQVAQPSKPPVEPWMLELPSVAEIKERTRVADPEQSVFRDRIARRILAEYISFRCGFTTDRVMFGVADTVMSMQNQYFGGRTDLDEAEIQSAFNRGMAYHVEVLSDVLPAKAVQAYTWTQGFQEAKAADDVYQAERREREAKRLKLEDMERRIQADKVDGVDRRVLGIEIGEPLNLPQCDGGTGSNNSAGFDLAMAMLKDPLGTFQGEFQGSAQTCLGDPIARSSLGMLEAVQLARGEPISPVPVVAVKIANSSCPDWLQLKGNCCWRF